ncbi:MAG: lysophospholipase [Chromatiales bacterium]|jgi:alpha-beta hydrolase superfamily lysophospholipase|nr:lysophospholipase [Chromatiales bacterium]
MQSPELFDNEVITADGYHLPMRRWYPEGEGAPEAVVLGVHGFNDYSAAFEVLGRALTQEGIAVYAYDQRGFGATDEKKRGIWAGQETLVSDLNTVARLLRARYPDIPLYIIGESMGGAVTITTLTSANPPPVDGAVLMAPAIWGRKIMPWYQRASLAVVRFIAPRLLLTGNMARRTGVRASDDVEVLYALGRDPLVQKGARVDTLYGLSELMNDALARAGDLSVPTLLLYGAKDEIIPPAAMCRLLSNVPQEHWPWRMVVYPQGFHMLTRYTGAATTQADIAAWLHDVAAPLPSGDEMNRDAARNLLCGTPIDQA